jgi:uncharacterized protein involved in exopolysaccharide biosynthesis
MPNYYRSEARLLPVESKGSGSIGGLASAAAAFGVSVPGGESGNDANSVDVLNSRWLREQLLQTKFHYHMRSWRFGAEQVEQGTLRDYLKAGNMDQAVQGVGRILSASRDLKSKVITISAETRSPELSQLIVQRAGKLLEVFLQEKGRTRGGAKAAFAEARLRESRREMDEAEDAFRHFLENNRNFLSSTDPSVRLKGSRLETELRLRQQLVSAIAMNREQALMEEKNDIPILNVLDPGNLPIDKSKPSRSAIVQFAMMLAGAGSWIWLNREWVRVRLMVGDDATPPIPREQL